MARVCVSKGLTLASDGQVSGGTRARISRQLTVEAHERAAITSLRLLTVLNVLFEDAHIIQQMRR